MIIVTLVATVVLVAGTWTYFDVALPRVPAFTAYAGRVATTSGTNWLLVGSDSREGLTQQQEQQLDTGDTADASGGRTDAIMLLHIPPDRGKPTLVSLPRDSLVAIHGYGPNKLNASYSFGGPTLLSRTVEQLTGLHIDHYLEVGFGGFAGVVDAVGGVRICLPAAIHDRNIDLDLPAGCQVLDGAHSLKYMRTRDTFAAGDLQREQNQRQFLMALVAECASRSVLLDPIKFVPMVLSLSRTVQISDGDRLYDLVQLGDLMHAAAGGGLATTNVPIGGSENLPDVGSVLLWDNKKASALFAGLH
ncbi:MAG TPA: LCP family protein [Amycolatopsis sp.]|nr:LCP family protein [Amycolatopsis sp.]